MKTTPIAAATATAKTNINTRFRISYLTLQPEKYVCKSDGIGMGFIADTLTPPVFPTGTLPNK
jgi:hypothetical protein